MVKDAFDNMERKKKRKLVKQCPLCGNPLVVRSGKYGKFVACSNYPNCKYVKKKEKTNS